ncbi:MAG: hypothetical protein ACI9HK_004309 [Pirellulaceae bacterium]
MDHKLKSTNVELIDRLLGGGTRVGVYGILGPSGVGKSVLANMIAANGATGKSIFKTPLYKELPWMLFDLHNGRGRTVQRVISHIGRIRRDDVGCESEEIQKYEEERRDELPTEDGLLIPSCEREYLALKAVYKQLFVWSDDDEQPAFSSLATQEWITDRITQTAYLQRGLGGIVIDGARHVWYASKDETDFSEREFLEQFVANFCRTLARRFQCPVWITHQIASAKCGAPPTTQLTHGDAADCKSFAEMMDACLVMRTASDLNPESVFSIQCIKGDRNLVSRERISLKHDRDFSTIVEA